jgi:hypothetical protein
MICRRHHLPAEGTEHLKPDFFGKHTPNSQMTPHASRSQRAQVAESCKPWRLRRSAVQQRLSRRSQRKNLHLLGTRSTSGQRALLGTRSIGQTPTNAIEAGPRPEKGSHPCKRCLRSRYCDKTGIESAPPMPRIHADPGNAGTASRSSGMRLTTDLPSSQGSVQNRVVSPFPTTQTMEALKKASVAGSAWQGRLAHDRARSVRLIQSHLARSARPRRVMSITPRPPK